MAVLDLAVTDHIATVRLNRPASRNALDAELVVQMARTWDQLRTDPTVRVVVVTGAGDSTFCAGFDLGTFIPLMTGARAPRRRVGSRGHAGRADGNYGQGHAA